MPRGRRGRVYLNEGRYNLQKSTMIITDKTDSWNAFDRTRGEENEPQERKHEVREEEMRLAVKSDQSR